MFATEGRVFPDLRPAPETILVFGAASQTGGPLIEHVLKHSSGPKLRLISTKSDTAAGLAQRFSSAEVMVANYLDLPSLIDAFAGVDAAYIVTPDFCAYEKRAMCNVAAAAYHHGRDPHLLKLTGTEPHINRLEELRRDMREMPGPAQQFQHARAVLDASGLPVTYLNSWAWFMSDFSTIFSASVMRRQVLSVPFNRVTTFIDPADIGEAAANLLMAPHDRNHDRLVRHTTGTERLDFVDAARIMSNALGVEITYEDDVQACRADLIEALGQPFDQAEQITNYYFAFAANEQLEQPRFVVTDELEHLLGRRPRSLHDWFVANRKTFFADGSPLRTAGVDQPPTLIDAPIQGFPERNETIEVNGHTEIR